MPIFKCSKCGMMENTAPSHYWTRESGSPALCTECDPEIGRWHGFFERRPPGPELVEGPDGFIYHRDDPLLKRLLERRT